MQLFSPNITPVLSPISMPVEYKREMMLQAFFGGNHQNQLVDSMYGLDSKRAQKTLALGVLEVWRWFSLEWRKEEWPLPSCYRCRYLGEYSNRQTITLEVESSDTNNVKGKIQDKEGIPQISRD